MTNPPEGAESPQIPRAVEPIRETHMPPTWPQWP